MQAMLTRLMPAVLDTVRPVHLSSLDFTIVKSLDQRSSAWGTRTPRGTLRHLSGYAKTSYGVCKIEK
jgi:hypothetical protein